MAGLAIVTLAGSAASSTPTLMWSGAKRVNILCNVAGGPGIDHVALTSQLCGEVKRLASRGSPLPVNVITFGDPAVLAENAVTLLVHASVTRHGRDHLLAFAIRPYRVSSDPVAVLFGAPPRAVALKGVRVAGPMVDAGINAALSEALPWRGAPRIAPLN